MWDIVGDLRPTGFQVYELDLPAAERVEKEMRMCLHVMSRHPMISSVSHKSVLSMFL